MGAPYRMIVSGYTQDVEKGLPSGVGGFQIDERRVTQVGGSADGVASPSYGQLVGDRLYVASETPDHGGVAAYALDERGRPLFARGVQFTEAAGTCFVLPLLQRRHVYGADYDSGSVCLCAVDADGALTGSVELIQHKGHGAPWPADSPHKDRQLSPHVHTLSIVPGTDLLAAVDLGLDRIMLYEVAEDGKLALAGTVDVPVHTGPRIVAYHPTLPLAALIGELSCELQLYELSPDGLTWTPLSTWDLLEGLAPETQDCEVPLAAHCAFSGDGRFLYASTRGPNILTTFAVDESGMLSKEFVCSSGGATPRHFALSPDDALLAVANQTSDAVTVFTRDGATGKLTPMTQFGFAAPSCIIWE